MNNIIDKRPVYYPSGPLPRLNQAREPWQAKNPTVTDLGQLPKPYLAKIVETVQTTVDRALACRALDPKDRGDEFSKIAKAAINKVNSLGLSEGEAFTVLSKLFTNWKISGMNQRSRIAYQEFQEYFAGLESEFTQSQDAGSQGKDHE